jgi:hypothetical protein
MYYSTANSARLQRISVELEKLVLPVTLVEMLQPLA